MQRPIQSNSYNFCNHSYNHCNSKYRDINDYSEYKIHNFGKCQSRYIATSKLSASSARRVIRQAIKQKLTASRKSTKNEADPVVTDLPYWRRLTKTNQRKTPQKNPSSLQSSTEFRR